MLLELLALSIAIAPPSRRANYLRRGESRLSRKRGEASPGDHYHEIPGEAHFVIGATSAPPGYFVADGSVTLKVDQAPKLFKLWGYTYGSFSSGQRFGTPDMRDRSPIGAGNIRNSGADDGLAFGAERTDRATNKHQHAVPFENAHRHGIPATSHSGGANRATGSFNAVNTIAASVNGSHDHTGNTGENGGHNHGGFVTEFVIGANPSVGGIFVVKIQ
jgi:microcystin-dependent protein